MLVCCLDFLSIFGVMKSGNQNGLFSLCVRVARKQHSHPNIMNQLYFDESFFLPKQRKNIKNTPSKALNEYVYTFDEAVDVNKKKH